MKNTTTTTNAIKKAIEEVEMDIQTQKILVNADGIQGYTLVLALLEKSLKILDEYGLP